MSTLDWTWLGLGALAGAVASVLFFAGLAWGMRLALRTARPTPVLLLSAAIRIALLLGAGWLIAAQGPWALAGFALAFLAARFAILAIFRRPTTNEAR
ncbi:ATP synthase subunit I [Pararhodobacter sp.]|uniref:N-ATPase subunit AtpR n=1 Tax=Pararhodobacter sp. TaxID=2127056 RepID=UPI002AFF3A14|nr:ATP synthase subunit I [Pararhodobacter sp.]